jgi:hypothetical protein
MAPPPGWGGAIVGSGDQGRGVVVVGTLNLKNLLAFVVVLGAVVHFFGGNVADPDLWAHLQYGRTFWAGQGVPMVETYSYTAAGETFYDHEWLTDVVFAGVHDTIGVEGLVIGKLGILALLMLLLVSTAQATRRLLAPEMDRIHPWTVAAVLVLGCAVIGPGATFRAQVFTMIFLGLEAWLLCGEDERRRTGDARRSPLTSWRLLLVPPILLVWANLHGGFLVGVGMFGLWAAGAALDRITETLREGKAQWRPVVGDIVGLGSMCALVVAAPLVNPFGIDLYLYLARTLDDHGQISEWYPVTLFSLEFLRFKILVALTALSFFAVRPVRASSFGAWAWRCTFALVAAYMAFAHQRHTVLFAIVAAPIVVVGIEDLRQRLLRSRPTLQPRRAVLGLVGAGALCLSLFQIGTWTRQLNDHGLSIRYGRLDYPVDAVEFLRAHGFSGNLAMPFEWGAFAITKLAPDSKVFIDGRFEAVYPPRVIEDYFAFLNGTPGWERLLDEYPTDIVVVQRWRGIHPRLFEREDLVYVYSDPASLIFVRPGPRTQGALDRVAASWDRSDFPRLATYFP